MFACALGAKELVFIRLGLGKTFGAVLVAGVDEAEEERMRLQRLGLELGMELAAEEVGMIGEFNDLHVGSVGRASGDAQSGAG